MPSGNEHLVSAVSGRPMQFKINPKEEVLSLFPTPVARFQLPNASVINPGLEAAILKREEAHEGVRFSNIGGWQSRQDLTEWPEPEISDLVDSMRCAVMNMISLYSRIQQFEAAVQIVAWANVNRSAAFNQVHCHPGNQWSGTYYVTPGEFDDNDVEYAGQLQIHDPRERADMVVHPGSPVGKPYRIAPRAGMMVLFPSWLAHSVNIFYSETTRISIAFNARTHSFKAV